MNCKNCRSGIPPLPYYREGDAEKPQKKVDEDACYDIFTSEDSGEIEPDEVKMLKTGIYLVIPRGFEVVVRPRSGLSTKYPNYIANSPGTIDATYRGEVKVIFVNNTDETAIIPKGTKIAQIGMRKVPEYEMSELTEKEFKKAKETADRGGGFGSSGNGALDEYIS
jgi:dUTP pyrophosphatase